MSSICIIPARGGSKRIPHKNIKPFLGKPILAYSIQAALESKLFDEVMVSTDEEAIAAIAREYGAQVPFLRSGETSGDYATIADVLEEVLVRYQQNGKQFDTLCCMFATAPLIMSSRLLEGLQILENELVDSVCPVVQFSYPILRALEISTDNYLRMVWPEYLKARSQDLKPVYHDSGSFYWARVQALFNEHTLFCQKGRALILDETEVQDIDSETDWKLAELKYTLLHE